MLRHWTRIAMCATAMVLPSLPGRGQECVGTCYDPPYVRINDLIFGVQIALGSFDLAACPSFDRNGDRRVTVDELVDAVWNALVGCGGDRIDADRCASAPRLRSIADGFGATSWTGDATREASDPILSCGCAASPRTTWATYVAPVDGILLVRALPPGPGYALAIHGGACGATTELACDDAGPTWLRADLSVAADTRYLLELSGPCDGSGGSVALRVDLCGDGAATGDEHCDDGNRVGGDGCDADCRYEGIGAVDSRAGGCGSGGEINLSVAPIGQLFLPTARALAGVDLLLHSDLLDPRQLIVRLHQFDLDGPVVGEGTTTVPGAAGYAWQHVRFPTPIAITEGDRYAIEASSDSDELLWVRAGATPACPLAYPNGGAIVGGNRLRGEDLVFRAYGAKP